MAQIDEKPTPPVDIGDGLELRDGRVLKAGRPATPADVPRRLDLPPEHPLHGLRALRVVPAGMPDCTVDDEGRLKPINTPEDDNG